MEPLERCRADPPLAFRFVETVVGKMEGMNPEDFEILDGQRKMFDSLETLMRSLMNFVTDVLEDENPQQQQQEQRSKRAHTGHRGKHTSTDTEDLHDDGMSYHHRHNEQNRTCVYNDEHPVLKRVLDCWKAVSLKAFKSHKMATRRFGIEQLGYIARTMQAKPSSTTPWLYENGVFVELFGERLDARVVERAEYLMTCVVADEQVMQLAILALPTTAVQQLMTGFVLKCGGQPSVCYFLDQVSSKLRDRDPKLSPGAYAFVLLMAKEQEKEDGYHNSSHGGKIYKEKELSALVTVLREAIQFATYKQYKSDHRYPFDELDMDKMMDTDIDAAKEQQEGSQINMLLEALGSLLKNTMKDVMDDLVTKCLLLISESFTEGLVIFILPFPEILCSFLCADNVTFLFPRCSEC